VTRFTVLIPTYTNGELIRCAIASVLRQTEQDFELLVVSDGAPEETHAIVRDFAFADPRIRLFLFPKGERHGETWRHEALLRARGEIVCYLSDDDVWFADHLAIMGDLLVDADFGNTRHTTVINPFALSCPAGNLADPAQRQRMMETRTNLFGLSFAGHRLDAYRKLPEGWAPAPEGLWTDLNMWRKWLAAPGTRAASSPLVSGLNFPAPRRRASPADGLAEQQTWFELFSDQAMVSALRACVPSDDRHPLALSVVAAEANRLRTEERRRHAAETARHESEKGVFGLWRQWVRKIAARRR